MAIRIHPAQPSEAVVIAAMFGEVMQGIMPAIGEPVFHFDQHQTAARPDPG